MDAMCRIGTETVAVVNGYRIRAVVAGLDGAKYYVDGLGQGPFWTFTEAERAAERAQKRGPQ